MQDCFQPQALAALLPGKTPSPRMFIGSCRRSGHVANETLIKKYESWNFNSGNYLFTTDTK